MLTTSRIFIWIVICFFFFKQKTAYEMRISDWSSDVCSSDLVGMLHLVDRLFAFERGEACDAPIVEHAIMQPILVDRGQLVLERLVEEIDDFFVRSEEHTSELQSLMRISYAVFCLKKKKITDQATTSICL